MPWIWTCITFIIKSPARAQESPLEFLFFINWLSLLKYGMFQALNHIYSYYSFLVLQEWCECDHFFPLLLPNPLRKIRLSFQKLKMRLEFILFLLKHSDVSNNRSNSIFKFYVFILIRVINLSNRVSMLFLRSSLVSDVTLMTSGSSKTSTIKTNIAYLQFLRLSNRIYKVFSLFCLLPL